MNWKIPFSSCDHVAHFLVSGLPGLSYKLCGGHFVNTNLAGEENGKRCEKCEKLLPLFQMWNPHMPIQVKQVRVASLFSTLG